MSYMDMQSLYNKKHTRYVGSNNVNALEDSTRSGVGYIVLNVITGTENIPLPQAYVVIYVRKNNGDQIPIMSVISTLNPILIQLPVAHSPGTLVGPAVDVHSVYDITITAEGYYTTRILNVRMFDDVRTDFNINMIPVAREYSIREIERIIELPLQ